MYSAKNKIKIAIVDDHKMFREGIRYILSKMPNCDIVFEAQNGKEFLEFLQQQMPDVILMDISMPIMDGVEATTMAIKKYPEAKIIALSMFGDQDYYYKMIHAGVKGFVLKETGSDELEQAIVEVINGNNYFSQELLRNVIFTIGKEKGKNDVRFSDREIEVWTLICKGMSNSEIADELHLSQRTVEGHRANLIKKTDTKNTVGLVMYAIKNEVIKL
jgi:DNA-binding NarL/FixJ family response regulator